MTEKELIAKLNNLKNIKPDGQWKASQREILLSQIENTGATSVSSWQNFWIVTRGVFSSVPQPAYFSLAIIFFLMGSLWFGRSLPINPNSSLYIAKTISERAHLNMTFGQSEKNQLAMQYAQEHAQEIVNTMADPSFQADNATVDKLNSSFKEEIAKLKNNLPAPVKDDSIVISADSSKDKDGVSVYDPQVEATKAATTTTTNTGVVKDPGKILDEAQVLFDQKNYQGAAEKLEEAKTAIK